MNKKQPYPMPGPFRVMIAAAVLVLAVGPALSWAAAATPVCTSPCCAPGAPAPEADHDSHGHGPAPAASLETSCCHPSAGAHCDLSRAPVKSFSVAVLKTRAASVTADAGVVAVQRIPIDAHLRASLLLTASTTGPSSFPPLFLLKNALLC